LAKNNNIPSSGAETGVSFIEISAKAIAAAQRNRRKNILLASSIVAGTMLGAVSLFMNVDGHSVSEKNTRHIITENAEQAYFNEWPEAAANTSGQAVQTRIRQHAESTKVSPVISKKSVLQYSKKDRELSQPAVDYIRAELMEMQKVSFNQPKRDQLLAMNSPSMGAVQKIHTANTPAGKNFEWFVGIGFNPQLSNYEIKNTGKFNAYDGYTHTNYISNLKNQSKVYSYNASVKGGFIYNKKWMLEGSIGYQSFRYMDSKKDGSSTASPVIHGPWMNNSALASNSYNYMNFSLQASRLFEFKHVGLKTGISFSASRLMSANSVIADGQHMFSMKKHHHGQPLNKWIYAPGVHIGVVKNLSDRVQMQASPNLYYNLNSMFNKNYIVSQKPYGVGFDLSLMIRIN
jgi:hypothetical protein